MPGASGAFFNILDQKLVLEGPVTRYNMQHCSVHSAPLHVTWTIGRNSTVHVPFETRPPRLPSRGVIVRDALPVKSFELKDGIHVGLSYFHWRRILNPIKKAYVSVKLWRLMATPNGDPNWNPSLLLLPPHPTNANHSHHSSSNALCKASSYSISRSPVPISSSL